MFVQNTQVSSTIRPLLRGSLSVHLGSDPLSVCPLLVNSPDPDHFLVVRLCRPGSQSRVRGWRIWNQKRGHFTFDIMDGVTTHVIHNHIHFLDYTVYRLWGIYDHIYRYVEVWVICYFYVVFWLSHPFPPQGHRCRLLENFTLHSILSFSVMIVLRTGTGRGRPSPSDF